MRRLCAGLLFTSKGLDSAHSLTIYLPRRHTLQCVFTCSSGTLSDLQTAAPPTMPPKKSQNLTPSPGPRATRAQTRGSRETSATTEIALDTTPKAPKPELRTQISHAYGSTTKRTPVKIAASLHSGGLAAALKKTMQLSQIEPVVENDARSEREPSLSVISEGSDEDHDMEGREPPVPPRPALAEQPRRSTRRNVSMQESSPIFSANDSLSLRRSKPYLGHNGVQTAAAVDATEKEVPSTAHSDQLMAELMARAANSNAEAAAASATAASRAHSASFTGRGYWKWLVLGTLLLAAASIAASGAPEILSAIPPLIATGLSQVQDFARASASRLSPPYSRVHAQPYTNSPATLDTGSIAKLSADIERLRSRVAYLETHKPRPQQQTTGPVRLGPQGINVVAISSGVLVDHYLTSPTRQVAEKTTGGAWYRAFLGTPQHKPADAYAALSAWEDYGDCWCAASSQSDGRAQLALVLPRKVAPHTLVLEHIPQHATPDPGATPRDVEVWVRIVDVELRELVAARSRAVFGERPAEQAKTDMPALDDTWVRVLRDTYRRDPAAAHVQTFEVHPDMRLAELGVFVTRVALRVTRNWGLADRTCLYRVKMFGALLEEEQPLLD